MDRDSMVAASSSPIHIGLSWSSISPSVSSDTNSSKSTHRISQDKHAQGNRIYPNHHLYQRSETTASSTSSESKSGQQQRCRERRHHGRSKSSRTSRQSNSSKISLSQQYQLQTFMNAPSSLNWEELVDSLKRSQRSGEKIINSTIEVVEDDDVSLLGSRSGGTRRVDRNRDMDEIQGGRSGKSLVDSDGSDDSDDDQDAMDSLGSIISSPSDELQKSEEASPIHLLAQQKDSEHEESSVPDRGKELSESREITNERLRLIVARVVTDQVDLDTSNPYAEQLIEKRKRFSPATTSSPTKAGNPIDESDGLVGGRDSAFDQISPTSAAVHLMSSGHTEPDGENRQSQSRADAAISTCHLPGPQDFHPLQPHPTSPSARFEQIMIPHPISQKKRRQGIEFPPNVSSRVELDDPPLWPCEDNLEADGVVAYDGDTGSSDIVLSPRVTMTRRLDMQADNGSNERAQVADMERDENDSSAIEPCAFVANWEVFEASTHGEHEEEFELSPNPKKWDVFDEPDHDGGGSLINLGSSSSDPQNSTVVVDNTDKLAEVAPRPSPRVATARRPSAGQRHDHRETAPFVVLQRSLSVNRKDPTCLQVTIHRIRRTKAEF